MDVIAVAHEAAMFMRGLAAPAQRRRQGDRGQRAFQYRALVDDPPGVPVPAVPGLDFPHRSLTTVHAQTNNGACTPGGRSYLVRYGAGEGLESFELRPVAEGSRGYAGEAADKKGQVVDDPGGHAVRTSRKGRIFRPCRGGAPARPAECRYCESVASKHLQW